MRRNICCLLIITLVSHLLYGQDTSSKQNSKQNDVKNSVQELEKVPVISKNDTLFFIKSVKGNYPATVRARAINKNLKILASSYNKLTDSFYLKTSHDYIEISCNRNLLLTVTQGDAILEGKPIEILAKLRKQNIKEHFEKNSIISNIEWFKRIGSFLLCLLALYGIVRLINLLFSKINKRLSKIERHFLNRNGSLLRYFIPGNSNNIFVFLMNVLRIGLIIFLLFIGTPFMFSFFPFSEKLVQKFYIYIEEPVIYIFNGIIDFIPSLFFIIIIGITARYFARVLNVITTDIEREKLQLHNFHKDWAKPTGKLLTIFIYAFALVLIFPYLPGSGSSAFQGVSIFIGAIISFGSTSAIANIIAGIVITYMRPFQIGDRVKIDNLVGDIINKTILVTHLRTTKNEDVTIPNANILVGNIINYSSPETGNLIVHTTITLGYDVPWETANDLLLKAANRAPLLFKDPAPFVLQTSLDDFYVSYELNAYTEAYKKTPFIYSEIHKYILDVFDEAGIEILSPGYTAARDGSVTTVPSHLNSETKSPISKLIDHLTGSNQPNITNKKN
ncbi:MULTISPECIES: mechanosensitive ion channel family protein [unclassified Winogradskyella]|uniref:mechanosensitive ion channel family protein n=1 Tax=unclassified Winogradskyella TaxID=2615021 RepID=UPI000B3CB406|nr:MULTISPECIES: mechanosensitive ion channel family protein [unclassified Winogradskyella]